MTAATRCRHCRTNKACRARGLCFGCSRRPEVRALYPLPPNHHRRRGSGIDNTAPRLAPRPTAALPGTPEKIAVMAERAANGYAVFHPLDSRWGELGNDRRPPPPHKSGAGKGVSPRCRHCHTRAVCRRGLCQPCYDMPAVRATHALPKRKPGPKQRVA